MASNNIILAVPSANSSVNYELPKSESAQLSFSPEDIDGIKLDDNGGLVLSFVEGGQVTLQNFQSFVDNGNTLTLADGTQVDPKLLFSAVGGESSTVVADDVTRIGIPAENAQVEYDLEPGKKYLFDFDLTETQGANVKGGDMVIDFANGGKIVINDYEKAMAAKDAPELSLAAKTCIVSGDELITNIQNLAKTQVVEEVVEEEKETGARKSKVADADMEGRDDIGPGTATKLGYKAPEIEPTAEDLANIETAAGGAGAGGRNGGYGYQSRFTPDPFITNPDIGPINPTMLRYKAPLLEPNRFIDEDETPPDDNPIAIKPDAKFLDETNLAGGAIQVSGNVEVDYGDDGFGSFATNGTFIAGGSLLNNALTHNGTPIDISFNGTSYTGTAGGVTIFDIVFDPETGNYTFTQYENIDHADGTDPNDQISLTFGVTATDGNGDAVSTVVQIIIADDIPEIGDGYESVDETNLGPIVEAGTLANTFGQDGQGVISTTGDFQATGSVKNGVLSSGGVPVDISFNGTTYTGTVNGALAFTLSINSATGDYVYTQYKNLDHANPNDPNDVITLTFGVEIEDYDGDVEPGQIVIDIKDDAPEFQDCGPTPDNGYEIVDETNLGPVVETGKLNADFGVDLPGSYAFKDAATFSSSGSKKDGALTHEGVPVVVTLEGGVYIGKAGTETIFTLELDTATGDYKFTLFDNFDHEDTTNPDDIITLDFAVTATDGDGDAMDGTIRIDVKDDGPIANDDVNTYDTTFGIANGNVITGLNGGPGAADDISTDNDLTPQQNSVTKIGFEGNFVDVPAVGTVSIDGDFGTLTIAADGTYTYEAFDNGGMINNGGPKEFVSGPALPDFDESEALDGVEQQSLGIAAGNFDVNAGDEVTIKYVGEVAGYDNTLGIFTIDGDGKLKAEKIVIKSSDDAIPGQPISYTAGASSIGFFLIADGANANNNYNNVNLNTGTLNFVYHYGQPDERDALATDDGSAISLVHTSATDVETVISGPLYFSSDRGGAENLNADGTVRVVSGIPNGDENTLRVGFEDLPGLGDKDFNDLIFDVSITTKDCGCHDPEIQDQFQYILTDGDGDSDPATLTLNGQDLTDDKPILVAPAAEHVDETYLTGGILTETGNVVADYGNDGPGQVTVNGAFVSNGSRLNDQLSHNGVPVVVSVVGNTYVGKAGDLTIFTLKVNASGAYEFKLYDNLDHKDGTDPNDVINLKFGVTATDCDGDSCETTITVCVKDDGPCANDDKNSLGKNGSANGNVIDGTNGGAGAADVLSTDAPNKVSKITFGNTSVDVPTNGSNVSINGQYGKLTINSTGAYTYVLFDGSKELDGKFKDDFTYTLKDSDGDTDPAKLTLDFEAECKPVTVEICVNNGADGCCIKEDSTNNIVPVTAKWEGGSGNEIMTLTLTGVATNWGFSAQGWTNQGGGTWTITLPAGQKNYSGNFSFSPPAQSDVDLTGLNVKASVYDPDNGKTVAANDGFKLQVDAVIDPLKFTASLKDHEWAEGSGKIFVLTKDNYVQHSKLTITNLLHADKDGSEALKSITFTIQDKMDNSTYISVKNADGTFSKIGVKGADGNDTTYTIDLSGMTYEEAESFIKTKIYLTNTGHSGLDGKYELGIKLVSFEKNLSGGECDLTNNETCYTVCLPVLFCISPLVMDLDGDGVELLAQGSGVLFDMTNDGVRDDTGWSDKDDALLALDKNGDGTINDRSELFGNDDLYGNGFDNLAQYDLNKDGVIDSSDAIFKDLKAWKDGNSDGVSQSEELKSLSDVGIKAIKLNAGEVSYDIAGNPITHESAVVHSDGSETKVVDAWFAYQSGAGVDKGLTLVGTDGGDVISGSAGSDDLFGGLGADTFLFQTITEGVDTLKDFNSAEGDKIDLSNVLTNYDAVTDAINDFVFAKTDENGNTVLSVNVDGTGESLGKAFAIIESANLNVSDLFNNGSLVA